MHCLKFSLLGWDQTSVASATLLCLSPMLDSTVINILSLSFPPMYPKWLTWCPLSLEKETERSCKSSPAGSADRPPAQILTTPRRRQTPQKAKKSRFPSFLLSRIPSPSTTSPAPPPVPGRLKRRNRSCCWWWRPPGEAAEPEA